MRIRVADVHGAPDQAVRSVDPAGTVVVRHCRGRADHADTNPAAVLVTVTVTMEMAVTVTGAVELAVAVTMAMEMAMAAEMIVTTEVVSATELRAAVEAAAVTAEAAGFGIGCGDGNRTGESQSCDREIFGRLAGHGTFLELAEA